MATEWYYSAGDEKHGPVTAAELRQLATNGQLQSDHLVWKEGLAEWVEARKIKGLFQTGSPPLALSRPPQPPIRDADNSSPSPAPKPVITKAVFFFFDTPNLPQAMSSLGKIELAFRREYSFDQLGEGTVEICNIPKTAEWTKELMTPTEENQYLHFGLLVASARKYTQEQSYNNICRMYILHNMERIIRDEFGIDRKRDGNKVLYSEIDHGGFALLLDREVPLEHWKFNLAYGVSLQSLYADFDAAGNVKNATSIKATKTQATSSSRNPRDFPAPNAKNLAGPVAGPFFECSRPSGSATCSDDSCPCPGATIPPGSGYLYISEEVIEFRKDAIAESAAVAKIQDLQRKLGAIVANPQLLASPVLMCRMGAEKRSIDLDVAAQDARHWWETGQVPLRPTPMAGHAASAHAAVESSPKAPWRPQSNAMRSLMLHATGTNGNTADEAAVKEKLRVDLVARCFAQHIENTGEVVSKETTKKWVMAVYTLDQQHLEMLLADNDALQWFLKALLKDPQQAAMAVKFGQLVTTKAAIPPASTGGLFSPKPCKRCGELVKNSEWTCPHCGRTDWGTVATGGLVSAALLGIGVYGFLDTADPEGGRAAGWLFSVLGVLFLLVTINGIVKGLRAPKKAWDRGAIEDIQGFQAEPAVADDCNGTGAEVHTSGPNTTKHQALPTMDTTCPHCGKHLRPKPEWAGRTATCKSCNGQFVIPAPPSPKDDEVQFELVQPSESSNPLARSAESDENPFDFLNEDITETPSVERSPAAKPPRQTFRLTTILGMCFLALLAGVAATVVAMRSTVSTADNNDEIAEHSESLSPSKKSREVSKGKAANAIERRKPNALKVADTTTLTFPRDATRQLPFADPNAVMFSADGSRLLAVGENDAKEPTLMVWSTRSWKVEASAVLPTSASHLATTHDQSMVIIFSGKDEKLWLLDPQSFTIRATLTTPGNVIAFSVAPNALEAASVSAGEWQIQLWDLQNRSVKKVLPGPAELATCIAYSPDGSRLATTGIAKVALWNTNTGAVARNFDLGGEKTAAFYVAFSPDGKLLAASCNDSKTRIWNVDSGDSVNTLSDDKENVFSVAFAPDGRSILTRSLKAFDRSDKFSIIVALATGADVSLWNLATRQAQQLNAGVSLLKPQSFAMSPNGLVIACATNKTIGVWEAKPKP